MKLEDLGIDVESMKEQIIQTASRELVDAITAKEQEQIRLAVHKTVEKKISAEINKLVESALTVAYTPVDEWGEPKGQKTTLRETLKKSVIEWWSTRVDDKGEPTTSTWGSYKTRSYFVAHKVIAEILNNQLKGDLEKIVTSAKEQLKADLALRITEVVAKL